MSQTKSLQQHLEQEAAAQGGWLAFDQFMQAALLHPQGGYYARTDRAAGPFGAAGDFQTAPEMGPWMGYAVAQSFRRLTQEMGPSLSILEVGPGTGALAAQVLIALAEWNCLPQTYWLDEPSAHLRALQRATLHTALSRRADGAALWSRLAWVGETAPHTPSAQDASQALSLRGLVLAHEVFDALPVKRLEWRGPMANRLDEVLEWGVVWDASESRWQWSPRIANESLSGIVRARALAAQAWGEWARGHLCEVAPGLEDFIKSLWRPLASGLMLVVDYGYEQHELDHPDRHRGTLAAYSQHRRLDDPNDWIHEPGSRDLTAHVDFTQLAKHLSGLGASALSLKSQAAWLLDQDILSLAQDMIFPAPGDLGRVPKDPQRLRALSDLQTLLSDSAMGQTFSVLSAFKLPSEPGQPTGPHGQRD
jgi:SAM-dependent MidA family methyltransferase